MTATSMRGKQARHPSVGVHDPSGALDLPNRVVSWLPQIKHGFLLNLSAIVFV